MRGSKAKRLRRERPDRPNPGRVMGGTKGLDQAVIQRQKWYQEWTDKMAGRTNGKTQNG